MAVLTAHIATAQDRTVGLHLNESGAYAGYTLFTPRLSDDTYLIDMEGRLVHEWAGTSPALQVELLPNGMLMRAVDDFHPDVSRNAGKTGRVELVDWDGNVTWSYTLNTSDQHLHHDVLAMPNGKVLMSSWERMSIAEAIEAGRDPDAVPDGGLLTERIIEVDPSTNAIVWEWRMRDHLIQELDPTKSNFGVVADNPGKLDINTYRQVTEDWNHVSGLDYNPHTDEILISGHGQDSIFVIDHSVTSAEAATEAGDFVYRWGNPGNYDQGNFGDRHFQSMHDAQWIVDGLPGEGNILAFNNGFQQGQSSAEELVPPIQADGTYGEIPYRPEELEWIYGGDDPEFYSGAMGGVQRLPNGNTLITEGAYGEITEVTEAGDVVWYYVNPALEESVLYWDEEIPGNTAGTIQQNEIFLARRYDANYPGLSGRALIPSARLELYQTAYGPEIVVEQPAGTNLADGGIPVDFGSILLGNSEELSLTIHNTGDLELTGISATIDGTHASEFAITVAPAIALSPGQSTTLTVGFNPTVSGAKSAALHIASSDPDENPFDIPLAGTGLADSDGDGASDTWEIDNGFDPNLSGDLATLDRDGDGDGDLDILEIFQGTDRESAAEKFGIGIVNDQVTGSDPTFEYRRSTSQTAVNATSQWSSNLNNFHDSGTTAEGLTVVITESVAGSNNDSEIIEASVSVTAGTPPKLFFRLHLQPNE